jgi:hypothetical protein
MEIDQIFQQMYGKEFDELRPDQMRALDCLVAVQREVIESQTPIALMCVYIGESDILKDSPVFLYTNLPERIKKDLIRHAYNRVIGREGDKAK